MKDHEEIGEVENLLNKALKRGASYSDVRFQSYESELVSVENKALDSYSSRKLSGFGVRVFVDGAVGFASSSDLSQKSTEKTLDSAVKAARAVKNREGSLARVHINQANVRSTAKVDPFGIPPEEKVSIALDANKAAWNDDKIKNASTRLGMTKDYRWFASTEGARVAVETTMTGVMHISVAQVNGIMEWVPDSESACSGFEFIKSTDWNTFTSGISQLAIEAVESKTPPPGTYPVVVDPDIVGVLLHEAFGHASEGDLVSSGESVLANRIGSRLAPENVTIIDEGVVEGGFYYPYDDEGVKKEKTVVVEKGVLKGFIFDRESASKLGGSPTGNGRAQDFENLPIVRQTNYMMQPSEIRFEELVEDIDIGVYVRGRGSTGGEVEVGMGTFTFGVGPSKMIRNGEVAETVRGVVISGSILDTLKTVDGVGKDLVVKTSVFGGCGKSAQRATVGFGGPHIRARKMTVGGR
jgi:TldD protein